MRGLVVILGLVACAPLVSASTLRFEADFDTFTGTGLDRSGAAGALDSEVWRILGLSEGPSLFSGRHLGGDFGRGQSGGGVTTGGIYAFDVRNGAGVDRALGVQATGADLTPGAVELRIFNDTTDPLHAFSVAYQMYTRNNADRQSRVQFSYGFGLDGPLVALPKLDHLTPGLRTPESRWMLTPVQATFAALGAGWAPGQSLRLRWTFDDHSGGGSRDELAIDNLAITGSATPALSGPTELGTFGLALLGAGPLLITAHVRRARSNRSLDEP